MSHPLPGARGMMLVVFAYALLATGATQTYVGEVFHIDQSAVSNVLKDLLIPFVRDCVKDSG